MRAIPTPQDPVIWLRFLRQIFEKQGYKVDVRLNNWVRSVKAARAQKITGLVGCSHSDAPDFIFPEKPVGVMKSAYFTNKESTWVYTDRFSIDKKRIGVINGYSYGDSIDPLLRHRNKSFIPFSGERPLEQIIKRTESGHLDAFVENPLVLHNMLATLGISEDSFRIAGWVASTDPFLYVGFSPGHEKSKTYAQILDKGLVELRRSGELRRILEKYDTQDWELAAKGSGTVNDLRPRVFKSAFDFFNVINTGSF